MRFILRGFHADYILQILSAFVAILGGIVSAVGPTTPFQKAIWIVVFLCLGFCIYLIAFVQSRQARETQGELRSQIDQLQIASSSAVALQEANNELQKQVLELSQSNAKLTEDSINTTTGGDSFCFGNVNFQFEKPFLIFMHSGRYPIYDVQVRVVDMNKRTSMSEPGSVVCEMGFTVIPVGGAAQGPEFTIPLSGADTQRFRFVFIARIGRWNENLVIHRGKFKWSCSIRVWPKETNPPTRPEKPIFEFVDCDFPRNSVSVRRTHVRVLGQ